MTVEVVFIELDPDEERPIDETMVDLDAMIDRIIRASS